MEFIQALIYTTRYIFRDGNLDWYYFMAIIVAVFLFISKNYKKYVKPGALLLGVMLVITLTSLLFSGLQPSLKGSVVSIGKIALCLILMFGTMQYFHQCKLKQFVYFAAAIHLVETVVALCLVRAPLWKMNDIENGFYETRLQLFYMEPSELSMCAALLLILLYYLFEKDGFSWTYVPCALIFLTDMYLSAGMGGMVSLAGAIGIVLLYHAVKEAVTKKNFWWLAAFAVLGVMALLFVFLIDLPITMRIRLILSGKVNADSSTTWRLLMPLKAIGPILCGTHFVGVGPGNFNAESTRRWMGALLGWDNWFPNSFLYFFAEGGVLAILSVLSGVFYLGKKTIISGKKSMLMLFSFIVIYQIPGGYFTNPLNWICYGVLLAGSMTVKENELGEEVKQ